MSLGPGSCSAHPDRPGLGICVDCRKVLCAECTTRFEGINRCAACLEARLQATRRLVPRTDWSVGGVAQALLALALLYGAVLGVSTALAR